jgi:hypothetical protein
MLGVGRVLKYPTPENRAVADPPDPMDEDHWGGQDAHRLVQPVKNHELCTNIVQIVMSVIYGYLPRLLK